MLKQSNLRKSISLDNLLIKLYIVILFVPFLSRKINGMLLIILLLFWAIVAIYRFKKLTINTFVVPIFSFLLMSLYVTIRYFTSTKESLSDFGNAAIYIMFAFYLIVQNIFIKAYSRDEVKGFLKVAYITVLFTAFTSFISLCINIEASKIVTGLGPDTVFYKWHNVADYLGAFVMGLTAIVSIYLFQSKKGNQRYWYLAASLFLIVILIMCSSLIAIGATLLSMAIFLIVSIKNRNVKTIIYLVLGVLLTVFLILYLAAPKFLYDVAVTIADAIPIGNITFRIKELAESFFITKEFSFTGRVELWQASFDSFAKNPIFGVGFSIGRDSLSAHSQIFDDLAKLGIVGFGIMSFIFLYSSKDCMRKFKEGSNKLFLSIMVGVIIFSIFNLSMSFELMFLLMVILPILSKYYCKGEKK